MDDLLVADAKADAPTRHVVALRQREELDADVLGARHLEKTRRLIAVECQIGIGQIVDDDEAMLLGRFDDALKKIQLDHLGRRVMRKADDQHLRLGPGLPDRFFEMAEELFAGGQRNTAQIAAGQNNGILMNRIGRARTKHHIAGIDGRPGEMGQSFFSADGDDGFGCPDRCRRW